MLNLFRIQIISRPSDSPGSEYVYDTQYLVRDTNKTVEDEEIRVMIVDILSEVSGKDIDPFELNMEITKVDVNRWFSGTIPNDVYLGLSSGRFDIKQEDLKVVQKEAKSLVQKFLANPNDLNVLAKFSALLDQTEN